MRWFVCGLGLWVAAALLGSSRITYTGAGAIVVAGFILAIINSLIKPLVVVLSLPAILFSLGLFMLVINGLMVFLVSELYKPLHVENFGAAILVGLIIGFVNYLVTTIVDNHQERKRA